MHVLWQFSACSQAEERKNGSVHKNPSPRCHPMQDVRESKESWASVYSSENKEKLKDRSKPSWHALSDEAGGPFRGKPAKQGRIQKYNTYSSKQIPCNHERIFRDKSIDSHHTVSVYRDEPD